MNEVINNEVEKEEGITLTDLFSIIWNNKYLVFFVTLWITLSGLVYTLVAITPQYTAETSIMVQVDVTQTSTSEQSAIYVAQNLIDTYNNFLVSEKVLQSVIDDVPELQGTSTRSLKNSITVESPSGVLIIFISVENSDPNLAAVIADQLVENSIQIANDEDNAYIFLQNKLQLLDVAEVPASPSSPSLMLNTVISLMIGIIVSLGIVFVKELFNNKFQNTQEVERFLKTNVIAAVPGTMKERKLVE